MSFCFPDQEDGNETEKGDSMEQEENNETADDSRNVSNNSSKKSGIDHFNNEETDPMKTNAMSKNSQ